MGSIFAQANSAGLQMDVFDLTAVFASEDPDFHLAQDWAAVEADLRRSPALDGIGRNEFLSAVSLMFPVRKARRVGSARHPAAFARGVQGGVGNAAHHVPRGCGVPCGALHPELRTGSLQ